MFLVIGMVIIAIEISQASLASPGQEPARVSVLRDWRLNLTDVREIKTRKVFLPRGFAGDSTSRSVTCRDRAGVLMLPNGYPISIHSK